MGDRCTAVIWKRDTYRRTGRGRSGFELHYNECRCSRKATQEGLCTQHGRLVAQGLNLLRVEPLTPSDA